MQLHVVSFWYTVLVSTAFIIPNFFAVQTNLEAGKFGMLIETSFN